MNPTPCTETDSRTRLLAAEQRLLEQLSTVRTALYAGHNAALIETVRAHYPGAWKLFFVRDPETGQVRVEWAEHSAGISVRRMLDMSAESVAAADEEIQKVLEAYPVGEVLESGLNWISCWTPEEEYRWNQCYIMLDGLPTDTTVADDLLA